MVWSDPVDTCVWINLEIRIRFQDDFWLTQPKFGAK